MTEIFQKREVSLKTTDSFLEFPMKEVALDKNENGATIEIVCHPRYSSLGFIEIKELSKLHGSAGKL